MIWHTLTRQLAVWRDTVGPDGAGGRTTTAAEIGHVWAKVSQPTTRERLVAAQAGSEQTHVVHLAPDAMVRRGDQLRGRGQTFRVLDTIAPSGDGVYLRADCELIQAEEVT